MKSDMKFDSSLLFFYNSISFDLYEFFINDDIDGKRDMIRRMLKFWVDFITVEFC